MDISRLENALNVSVSGSYGGDRFNVSAAAEFANSSKDDAYTTNLIYLYSYSGKASFKAGSLGQGFSALTPYAAELEQKHPTKFREMCGNSYVSQMDAGAVLGVRLSLSFNSHADKESFNASMKGSYGLANIAAKIEKASSESKVHVDMKLSAYQAGGSPQNLNDIWGEFDEGGDYPMLKCQKGPDGVDSCTRMITNIITYAKTMKDQLSGMSEGVNLYKLYYTNPKTSNYETLGIELNGVPDPTPDILEAMQQLTTQYDKVMYDLKFATHYLSILSGKLDGDAKVSLRNAVTRLNNQSRLVFKLPVYNINDCYQGYVSSQCKIIRDNIERH